MIPDKGDATATAHRLYYMYDSFITVTTCGRTHPTFTPHFIRRAATKTWPGGLWNDGKTLNLQFARSARQPFYPIR